ncbi:MAG: 4'-phosphopantetheinyl transferase superfamily protein [Muribaculaceae bacterium]|nr:4'-phosphopantetheinyl transferase superfamily protein [Muribaculaceae bacterium]
MPFLREIPYSDGSHVYVWEVTETIDELVMMCQRRDIDTSMIAHVAARNRRIEMLVEHLLLHVILGRALPLQHTEHGQPYVTGTKKVFLSVSHTFGLVCVGVNRHHPIGIDVERKGTRALRVRDHFLDEREREFVRADDAEAALIAWTAKEALYKVVDDPQATMLGDLHLDAFKTGAVGTLIFGAEYRHRLFTVKVLSWHAHVLTLVVETVNDIPDKKHQALKPNIIEL